MSLKIGFAFNISNGGPSIFLRSLKKAFSLQKIAKTSYFINPFTNCNIYCNQVRNPWRKSYIFRVDGIGYDTSKSLEFLRKINEPIIEGINNALGVVYQSEHSKKLVESILKVKPLNSVVIINGTDLTKFSSIGQNMRQSLGIPQDALVFVTSAKWRPQKRSSDVIEVFKLFKEKSGLERIYLIVVGIDNKNDGKNNIIYIPEILNHEMPKYLRTADVYLFFSWLESCPNSVIEAIACGLPVITTNQGGTKEIIYATNGGLVVEADKEFDYSCTNLQSPPKPDYSSLLNALKELVDNLDFYKDRINTAAIDINETAKNYYNFLLEVYNYNSGIKSEI